MFKFETKAKLEENKEEEKPTSPGTKIASPSKKPVSPGKKSPVKDTKNSQIQIYAWNVNGLRATLKSGAFQKFVNQCKPMILCLNETKIDFDAIKNDKVDQQIEDLGYPKASQFWNCCTSQKGYSGTAILIHKDCHWSDFKHTLNFVTAPNVHNNEGRCVTVHFESLVLVCTYVPNSGVQGLKRLDYRTKEWDVEMQTYLKSLEKETGKPVAWCGDLNVAHQEIDIYGPKGKEKCAGFTPQERKSFDSFLKEADFVDTFRELNPGRTKYSFWNLRSGSRAKNQGWRIDYFVTSRKLMQRIRNSEIHNEFEGSDHCPISLTLD